jgi:hypothetical protein
MFMAATITVCERNGIYPGKITENIQSINWKAVDDTTTPYTNFNAVIGLGSNSYTKYNYFRFNGSFTSLGNVQVKHISGSLPAGVRLVSSGSISNDSAKQLYRTPTRSNNGSITSTNISAIDSTINLLVGPAGNAKDPAANGNKTLINNNTNGSLYTNYFVSQIQVANNAITGDIGPIVLEISYDEV